MALPSTSTGSNALNAGAVKRWSAVQKHRMVFNDLFQDVPNNRFLLLHHFLGLLDGGAVSGLFEPVVDERLEEFERHFLGQAALVQLELWSHDDDGSARVVDAL